MDTDGKRETKRPQSTLQARKDEEGAVRYDLADAIDGVAASTGSSVAVQTTYRSLNALERANAVALPLLGSFFRALTARGSALTLLVFLFALLMGTASQALGAEKFCSDPPYFGVIDGDRHPVLPR
jgi:hypothetical protein